MSRTFDRSAKPSRGGSGALASVLPQETKCDKVGPSRSSAVTDSSSGITVVALTHDLIRKRSIVTMTWDTDAEKKVGLPVSYGCSLEDVRAEAERALRALSTETATLIVKLAG
jgi:hypothetical protein